MAMDIKSQMEYTRDALTRLYNAISGKNLTTGEIIRNALEKSGSIDDSLHRLFGGESR